MKADFDIRVAELLCSRLCHELVSPVGAINNGVELIEEMGAEMADDAIGLIAHSADQAARRLRLLRLAYGAAGSESGAGMADAQQAAATYFADSKVTLDWPAGRLPPEHTQRRGAAKLTLNLLVLAEEALAYGGKARVESGASGLSVTAEGRQAGLKPETRAALDGAVTPDALSPRTVHAYATGRFAEHYGFTISLAEAPERLVMSLVF
jgi:histidine phosphotransferase ChpT